MTPPETGVRNASCFSAVTPVIGWNQCVKCVQPFATAHSLMAFATESAASFGSGVPILRVHMTAS